MICYYYLTFRCNASCEYCRIWQDEDFKDINESSFSVISKNLYDLKRLGITKVHFTGGEPLIRDDISEILSVSKHNGFKTYLYTNGILYPDKAKALAKHIDILYISLDAPGEDEHNRIKGQECYKEAMDSIKAARSARQKAVLLFTVTRDSIQYLPDMVEMAQAKGVTLKINPVYDFNGLEGFEKISVDYLLRYKKNNNVEVNLAAMELLKKRGNSRSFPVCRAADQVVTISPDDRLIMPCITLRQGYVPINGRLKELYRGAALNEYRKLQGRYEKCDGCLNWDYIIPSFGCKIDKYNFLNRISRWK